MIEARSLDEAHDVIGDLFEAGFRRRALLGLEFGELGLGIGGERRLSVRVARTAQPVAQGLGCDSATGASVASSTRRIASCDAWARSITTPRRLSSPITARPKALSPPLRGASVAESTQSRLSLWQSVISRTPAACQMRRGLSEFSSPAPPSTAMKDAILPRDFALP